MTEQIDPPTPPASERRGTPGHDSAGEVANGVELLRLRALGMTYDQIAAEKGYADRAGARNALMRALHRHEAENAAELRTIENLRYDASERVLRGIAGDTTQKARDRISAIDALTRLSARRARLNGLDAPVAVQISAGVQAGMEDALAELETVVGEVIQLPAREPLAIEAGTTDDEALEA